MSDVTNYASKKNVFPIACDWLSDASGDVTVSILDYSGYKISPYYDALISKLIVHEESRKETISRMKRALDEYRVIGIRTNIPFHQALLENPDFLAGEFNTQFIQDGNLPVSGNQMDQSLPEIAALTAVLATHKRTQQSAVTMQRGKRDTSNWKWVSRWERTQD